MERKEDEKKLQLKILPGFQHIEQNQLCGTPLHRRAGGISSKKGARTSIGILHKYLIWPVRNTLSRFGQIHLVIFLAVQNSSIGDLVTN